MILAVSSANADDEIVISGNLVATSTLTVDKNITLKTLNTNALINLDTVTTYVINVKAGTLELKGTESYPIIFDGGANDGQTLNYERFLGITSSGCANISYVTFQNLHGSSTSAAIFANSSGGTVNINNSTIDNIKGKMGTGIYASSLSILNISNCVIQNCEATSDGACVYLPAATTCNINNTQMKNNKVTAATSDQFGGGAMTISHANAVVTIDENSVIESNSSNTSGGGIIMDSGTLYIKNASIMNNTATNYGQNIYSTTDNAGSSGVVYINDVQQELGAIDKDIINGIIQ